MEKYIPQLEIADYRALLTHYDRRSIRKIRIAGPDVPSILPTLRAEITRIECPEAILLSVGVPSADDILLSDMCSLLECVTDGNANLNVCWGLREHTSVPAIQVVVYVGTRAK